MKRYKLIREYPGSPKLGYIIEKDEDSFYLPDNNEETSFTELNYYPFDFPEFWEPVVEKDYEILSFKGKLTPRIYTLQPDGNYVCEQFTSFYFSNRDAFMLLKNGGLTIHSVKRLSDGEIFTIGDNIKIRNLKSKIDSFFIKNDNLMITSELSNCGDYLKSIKKINQLLFTTEDGVDIFEGNKYCYINSSFNNPWEIVNTKADCPYIINKNDLNYKRFSTKEKAEEYILMNKPVLSLSDVWDHLSIKNRKVLTKFVKNKLN